MKSLRAASLCMLHALILVGVSYAWMNLSWELPDERLVAKFNQMSRYVIFGSKSRIQELKKQFLFINCAYDKLLIPYEDDHGSGQITITDRQKLAGLLSVFNQAGRKPKLVVIDLLFIEPSPVDTLLSAALSQSQNLILGWDTDAGSIQLPPQLAKGQAAYYTASGTFLKYPVLSARDKTLPTAIYSFLEHKNPYSTWLGFVRMGSEWWLNSFIVDIEMRKAFLEDNQLAYVNLGEMLDAESAGEIEESTAGKIVIIGDIFMNDQHDTVLGKQPGPMIVLNTYLSMLKGQATITWSGSLLLFVFYFAVSWRIIAMAKDVSPNPAAPKFIRFMLKYVTYLLIFSVFSVILYQVMGKHFQILLFAFYFNILEHLMRRYEWMRNKIRAIAF